MSGRLPPELQLRGVADDRLRDTVTNWARDLRRFLESLSDRATVEALDALTATVADLEDTVGGITGFTVADAAADTTTWLVLAGTQTGAQSPKTDAGLTYNASTNVLTATGGLNTSGDVNASGAVSAGGDVYCTAVHASGAVSATNVSGTNTGDQYGSTTASRLIGRGSAAGAGAAQEITLGTGLSMSGTTLSATSTADMVKNAANTMGASGTIDASAQATGTFRSPNIAGAATTTAGAIEYDTTQGSLKTGAYQSASASVPVVLYASSSTSDTVTASVVGTTQTAFSQSYTLPANFLIANKTIRTTLGLYLSASTPPSLTIRVKLGGTTIYQTATQVLDSGTTAGGITLVTQGTAAAGASVNTVTAPSGGVTLSTNATWLRGATAQPVALATNGTLALTVTAEWSANTASNSVTLQSVLVEALN